MRILCCALAFAACFTLPDGAMAKDGRIAELIIWEKCLADKTSSAIAFRYEGSPEEIAQRALNGCAKWEEHARLAIMRKEAAGLLARGEAKNQSEAEEIVKQESVEQWPQFVEYYRKLMIESVNTSQSRRQ